MRTNKTANYELNQWALNDKPIMDEFNEDNKKIDVALSNKVDSEPVQWHDILLVGGATSVTTARFRKAYNVVFIEGWIKAPLSTAAFYLPEGFRPSQTIPIVVHSATPGSTAAKIALATIAANGAFTFTSTTDSTLFSENGAAIGCSFTSNP